MSLHPERNLQLVSFCYRSGKPASQLGCYLRWWTFSSHASKSRHVIG